MFQNNLSFISFFHVCTAYKDLRIGEFVLLDDLVSLNQAFSVRVGIDLTMGSAGYSAGGSNNYQFRIFLSKAEDMITAESVQGRNIPYSTSNCHPNA